MFNKIFGKKPKGLLGAKPKSQATEPTDSYAELAKLLVNYPAHRLPHIGNPLHLSDAQCDANLADLLTQRDHRLKTLSAFFAAQGIDIQPILQGDTQASETFATINNWLLSWLPKRPFDPVSGDKEPNAPYEQFMASDRSGDEIYLSFFSDLAVLLGEAIRKIDPRFDWQVYRAPTGLLVSSEEESGEPPMPANELRDERHICLVKPSDDPDYWPTILNLHVNIQYTCHTMMNPMGFFDHPIGQGYTDALSRRFDRPENGIY
jgi:hypothetical protein